MKVCRNADDPRYRVLLQWVVVSLGVGLSCVILFIFIYKWFNELDKKFRQKRMPRMTAVILTCMACERCMRLFSVYLRFHGSVTETYIVNTINNMVFLGGMFSTLFTLMATKLISNFEGSVYTLSERERKHLYSIVFADVISLYTFTLINAIQSVRTTSIGKIARLSSAVTYLILSVTLLIKVNTGFSKRLQSLVVGTSIHIGGLKLESPMSTPPRTPTAEIVSPSSDDPNNTTDDDPTTAIPPRFRKTMSITNIRHSSVNSFDFSEQIILKVAAKSMVITVWITFGIFAIFLASVLFIYAKCADLTRIFANVAVAIAYTVIALSLSFSLPHSTKEYIFFCGRCDSFLQHWVAFQTDQQVVDQLSSQPNNH